MGAARRRASVGRAIWASASVSLLCAGCAWVKLDEGAAQQSRVASKQDVASCKEVGRSVTQTRAKIGFIGRSEEKIASELEILARNAAPGLGADTVVEDGPVELSGANAKRRFALYRCGDVTD